MLKGPFARRRGLGLVAVLVGALITGCQEAADLSGGGIGTSQTSSPTRRPSHPPPTSVTPSEETTSSSRPTTARPTTSTARPGSAGGWWRPRPGLSWQWQLNGDVDTTVEADVFDIDLIHARAADVQALHAKGRKVICYVNVGAVEDYRPDARSFPDVIEGGANGWPGEKWLDIRRIDVLKPIMAARFDLCKAKGFDGVEPDLVDGYKENTGFPLTAADQLAYNRMLADLAHERGLAIGLKNDLDQVKDLVGVFDFAVNEQCAEYNECARLSPFITAGKAVFHAEYNVDRARFCGTSRQLGLSSILKETDLAATPRQTC